MAAWCSDLPFRVGATYADGFAYPWLASGVMTAANAGLDIMGQEFIIRDLSYATAQVPPLYGTNRTIRLRIVKNASGLLIPGGYAVQLDRLGQQITQFANTAGAPFAIVDPFLTPAFNETNTGVIASQGVVANDCCWVWIEGPVMIRRPDAGFTAAVNVNDYLQLVSGGANTTASGRQDTFPNQTTVPNFNVLKTSVARALKAYAIAPAGASTGGFGALVDLTQRTL